ncbi:high affinity cationic amino acid transporter 1-like [Branchiostoma lanceolatum]|uniref:high affinity cationic amino acid transporter 1-like n=1 Tax=Branchiostoma lanceolatum TaxID=7740 RepID=UPI0034568018
MAKMWQAFCRTKTTTTRELKETELSRCLGVFDLTALGIGSTLGAGIYVLAGQVARLQAGPGVVLSFLIAALASLLSGLCYAEFAARVPKAGSAYVYGYLAVGEFWAFVIGWNMVLEDMIGAASVAKAWSQYFDSFFNDSIRLTVEREIGTLHKAPGLGTYPDIIAFILLLLMTGVIASGVKQTSITNIIFTVVNMLVILCIVVVGCFYVNGQNWAGEENFLPYGFSGVLSGAATCFYAFVGFDIIATSSEEARNPSKSIPTAILLTLVTCFLAYFGVSAILTLMEPYSQIATTAPLARAFDQHGLYSVGYIISVGAICGLTASTLGSLFPLPRIVYTMAKDGLLCEVFARVHPRTSVPVVATLVSGSLAAVLSLVLDLQQLVEIMSIGTLMAYTLVAASVLIMRYQPGRVGLTKDESAFFPTSSEKTGLLSTSTASNGTAGKPKAGLSKYFKPKDSTGFVLMETDGEQENPKEQQQQQGTTTLMDSEAPSGGYQPLDVTESVPDPRPEPTPHTGQLVSWSVHIIVILMILTSATLIFAEDYVLGRAWWALLIICVLISAILSLLVFIWRQPQSRMRLPFKVPVCMVVCPVSMFVNIYLMLKLKPATWIRFAIWLAIGMVVYLGYGTRHSMEARRAEEKGVSPLPGVISAPKHEPIPEDTDQKES